MLNKTIDEKNKKLTLFSGKVKDWNMWSKNFLIQARRKGYKNILTGTVKAPKASETINENTDEGKIKAVLKESNLIAYEDLTLSMNGEYETGKVAFQIINGATNTNFPDGDATLAWKHLSEKYQATSALSRLMLRKKFKNYTLKNKQQDPDIWLTELENIQCQLEEAGHTMSDNNLIKHALNHLPNCYKISVSKLEDRIDDQNNPITIDQLQNELNLQFEQMKGKNNDNNKKDDEEEETALFAGEFKSKCHKCGKIGHKARDCREKTNNRKKVCCFYCKKEGHKIENCWKKKTMKKVNKSIKQQTTMEETESF